jgi:hypothetical protein
MKTPEKLELFRTENRYLCFKTELITEKKMLTHVKDCKQCREWIKSKMDGDEIYEYFGKLFDTIVFDPIVPKYKDYTELDKFIDDRINWRLDRLEGLINDAEKALIKISNIRN